MCLRTSSRPAACRSKRPLAAPLVALLGLAAPILNSERGVFAQVPSRAERDAGASPGEPRVVGTFPQEVARHRELQDPLVAGEIRSIRLASGEWQLFVQTTTGWVGRRDDGWAVCLARESDVPRDVPAELTVRQVALGPQGQQVLATEQGIFQRSGSDSWERMTIADGRGRVWAASDVRGVVFDREGQLWFATLAGVGQRTASGWRFFEGRDGLPYNDITCCAAGADGSVWFGTRRGAIRYQDGRWAYRQGLRWLPHDEVRGIAVQPDGTAWFATAGGVGCIARQMMSLQEKARWYEEEIERRIKRTPFGYVATSRLAQAGDKSSVIHEDSDNDGLWTAMYGASQCYAYAVTGSAETRARAQQAFEALRFLQRVTQGGNPSPPRGYVARTILPASGPDPNEGRLAGDRRQRATGDRLWKTYEPRWPKSADGQWYWKSDTSSDELDGHYFFYPLYFDLVAETPDEQQRVREVVRDLTDHLIEHDFVLQDHDGTPTRWGMFRPSVLNHDPDWMPERGLNAVSILSYLAVARHVTGDEKYHETARRLMETHHYRINALVPKVQRGIGSGNQSDDEMAFMSFYNLVKYTRDESLRREFLAAFFWYWTLEQPERNPFFDFAYAAFGRGQSLRDPFEQIDLSPWEGWLEDSVATLIGFPLDRVDWAHTNSHRLDLVRLPRQNGIGWLGENHGQRGYRVDGKVLPVEERFFEHWNTDPWRFDSGGTGHSLASGAVFLLPYYMGRYHGLIAEQ